jgi:hypothetical protein
MREPGHFRDTLLRPCDYRIEIAMCSHEQRSLTKPHQGAEREQLAIVLREAAQEGEHRKPRNRDLQRADAANAVRKRAWACIGGWMLDAMDVPSRLISEYHKVG